MTHLVMTTKPDSAKRKSTKRNSAKQGQSRQSQSRQSQPSKTYIGTVSGKRQITIPAELFRALRLQTGAKVSMKVEEGTLQVQAEQPDLVKLSRAFMFQGAEGGDSVQQVREMRGWTELDGEDKA